jgi:hypothetical protein
MSGNSAPFHAQQMGQMGRPANVSQQQQQVFTPTTCWYLSEPTTPCPHMARRRRQAESGRDWRFRPPPCLEGAVGPSEMPLGLCSSGCISPGRPHKMKLMWRKTGGAHFYTATVPSAAATTSASAAAAGQDRRAQLVRYSRVGPNESARAPTGGQRWHHQRSTRRSSTTHGGAGGHCSGA